MIEAPQYAYPQSLVTIGIPTFNRPDGLRKSLEFILKQTYTNLEIIISDNCSTDSRVQEIIHEFSARDQRIRSFRQRENIGLESNFNFVYQLAKGPYFIWMSDDDYFEADYIEKCVTFLESHPTFVLCSGVAKYYDGHQFLFTEPMFNVDQNSILGRLFQYFHLVQKNGNFYGVFRTGFLSTPPLPNILGSDWVFMAKMSVNGKLSYIDSTSYHRSIAGNSQTRKKMVEKAGLKNIKKLFFEIYLAYIISTNIFTDPEIRKKVGWLNRQLFKLMIFIQINWKLLFKFIKKKYRQLLKINPQGI